MQYHMQSGRSWDPSDRSMPWACKWRKHQALGEKHLSAGDKLLNHTRDTVLEAAHRQLKYEMCRAPKCFILLFVSLLSFATTTHYCPTEIVLMRPQ